MITIKDTIRPVFLSCVEDIEADSGTVIQYEIPTAFDNCGIDSFVLAEGLPSGSVFPEGETKVSFMAIDASGNYQCCSFFVRIGGTVTSINEEFAEGIKVYPNPVSDQLQIKLPEVGNQNAQIIVLSASGKQLTTYKVQNINGLLTSDVSDLNAGIYFLKIIYGEKVALRKVVKN